MSANDASAWRFELGRRIALAYAADPKARVVMIAGSTGRGTADRYSDLEIDVYWDESPTDEERREAVRRSGGTLLDLAPYEEDEWAEEISFGGFLVGTSTFLVETMERYLDEILERCSTEPLPQIRLYSVLNARTVAGEDLVETWRARARAYPDGLAAAMLEVNLAFDGFGYAEHMLAARDDLLALYDIFCRVERQILGALLGLNRVYLPNPFFKGMDEVIRTFDVAPVDLTRRLKRAFRLDAPAGVQLLHELCDDVLDLVDRHTSSFDTSRYRRALRERRREWDRPPES